MARRRGVFEELSESVLQHNGVIRLPSFAVPIFVPTSRIAALRAIASSATPEGRASL